MTNSVVVRPRRITNAAQSGLICAALPLPGTGSMVIDARHTFRCAHTYVALMVGGRPMFVCFTCEYRTELLPLRKPGTSCGPATLVNFATTGSDRASRTASMAGGI